MKKNKVDGDEELCLEALIYIEDQRRLAFSHSLSLGY